MLWCTVRKHQIITNSVNSGTIVQLMINVPLLHAVQCHGSQKKISMAALQNVFDERFVTRLLWPPRSPDLYPCENHLSMTLIDATYVNNPQTFHQHSVARVPPRVQKYFRRPPGLLRSWRSALGTCPVQYGNLNRECYDWSLQPRSVLLFCTHAFADIAELLVRRRPCSNRRSVLRSVRQVTSTRYLPNCSVRLSQWFQHSPARGALQPE